MFDGIKDAFKSAINWIIHGWNSLKFTIGGFTLPFPPHTKFPDFTFGVPPIPTLHTGGTFRAPDIGGEGFALLRDREQVTTPETMAAVVGRLDTLIEMVRQQTDWNIRIARTA